MEIGSFIELEFSKGKEYYSGTKDIARLNTGRAGIYYASQLLHCTIVYLPLYQCETVGKFLEKKGLTVKLYYIDYDFTPKIDKIEQDACIVLVNYFGIMSSDRMENLRKRFAKVVIDNSQAFFARPVNDAINVYSARKFIGVPDGAYVIGCGAEYDIKKYPSGKSSDTCAFLLQRIECGCEGDVYNNRMKNECRLDEEDVMQMSKLTRTILDGYDYERNISKRKENFEIACTLFGENNRIDVKKHYDDTCVPMIYPLLIEDDNLMNRLLEAKHFQGHWWNYILSIAQEGSCEYWLSKYMVPITIDQRYGEDELKYIGGYV